SEIDAVQWGVIFNSMDSCEGYIETLKLLIVLEIADKLVESAMAEYAQEGVLTDRAGGRLGRAINLLERGGEFTNGVNFDISSSISKGVDAEIWREEKLSNCDGLRQGDTPWIGASMEAYVGCSTVASYIDVIIYRISLWPLV
ncbi:MAG: hypothetical protein JSW38_06825, partial [Dehalococcoidia bacterium]